MVPSLATKIAVWLFAIVLMGAVVPWIVGGPAPMTFQSAEAVPDSATPGGRVTAYYRANVTRECNLDFEREWVDAKGFRWPSATAHGRYPVGLTPIGLTMVIPMDAAPGKATINNTILYSCNPWEALFPRSLPMPDLYVEVQR